MKSSPTFSFIIPARNEDSALQETLAHLQRTGVKESCEIVVVDDNSETPLSVNRGAPVCCSFHRSESRLGVARARNWGASKASGDILIFADAHVCFSGPLFDELRINHVEGGTGIHGCGTRLLTNYDQFVQVARDANQLFMPEGETYFGWRFTLEPYPNVVVNRQPLGPSAFCVPYVGACALAVSHQLFSELGGFDEGLTGFGSLEDAELAMRCWSFGHDVKVIPSVICNHYSNPCKAAPNATPSAFDHPRYDGSFMNSLRVMSLHLPEALFDDILSRLQRAIPGVDLAIARMDFQSTELRARRNWIDERRCRSREWLVERMTHL